MKSLYLALLFTLLILTASFASYQVNKVGSGGSDLCIGCAYNFSGFGELVPVTPEFIFKDRADFTFKDRADFTWKDRS